MQTITKISAVLQGLDTVTLGSANSDLALHPLQLNMQQNPFFEFKNVMRIFCPSQLQKALEQSNVVLWNGGTAREKIDELATLLPDYQIVGISDLSPTLANNKNEALSSSLNSHPPHLDGVYRNRLFDLVALQNVMTDNSGGGFGLFWNMKDLLVSMPKEYYDFLKANIIQYRRLKNDASGYDIYAGTMIHTNAEDKEIIRWRFDTQVRPELLNDDKEAQHFFEKCCAWILNFLCTHIPDVVPYQEGDFVLMKNSVFHGRTSLLSANRYVRRIWFDKK
jgi:hypothetical protein